MDPDLNIKEKSNGSAAGTISLNGGRTKGVPSDSVTRILRCCHRHHRRPSPGRKRAVIALGIRDLPDVVLGMDWVWRLDCCARLGGDAERFCWCQFIGNLAVVGQAGSDLEWGAPLILKDALAKPYALVANIDARSGNHLPDFVL